VLHQALWVSTKTHKISCMLAKWTIDVHAPGLAIDPPIFEDPSVFDSEPSLTLGIPPLSSLCHVPP